MKPAVVATHDAVRPSDPDGLASILLTIAADQNVRALEALAACLINRAKEPQDASALPPIERAPAGLPDSAMAGDSRRKLQVTRRIARRALRGSLADPTEGATACHRIDATPGWSRDLLPVATVGGFLFYKLPADERDRR